VASAVPSFQTPAVPLSSIPAALPFGPIPEDADHEALAKQAIERLSQSDVQLFSSDAQWRDVVALTGHVRTFFGDQSIGKTWNKLAGIHSPTDFSFAPGSSSIVRYGPIAWVEARFAFNLPRRSQRPRRDCSCIVRVAPDANNDWKVIVLVTLLDQLDGYGDVDKLERLDYDESSKQQTANGVHSGQDFFDCVIAGGGQAGLATAGRLKALGISHVVLDKNSEVGGSWLTRYKSFKLHTSKFHSEMPFGGVFDKDSPYFLSSGHLAAGHKAFVEWYGLNVWLSASLTRASWNEKDQTWTLELAQHHAGANGTETTNGGPQTRRIKARHLVLAIGSGGQSPKIPTIPNSQAYKGEVLHSVNYTSAAKWKGKRGIVVGGANSAHDVATDMADAGLSSVTVLQRSPTMIFPLATYRAVFDPIYNEKISIDLADKLSLSIPLNITRAGALGAISQMADAMPEYWAELQ
jgi:hypothetical protein